MLRRLLQSRQADGVYPLSFVDWVKQFQPGNTFTYGGAGQVSVKVGGRGGAPYGSNSIVFAAESIRLGVFSQARFAIQSLDRGKAGALEDRPRISDTFRQPWPGGHTSDLLTQAEFDVFCCGNSFWVRDANGDLMWLDPTKVKPVTVGMQPYGLYASQPGYVGQQLDGYVYQHGPNIDDLTRFEPEEVAHYKPYASLESRWLGSSWLPAAANDVGADDAITQHKIAQLQNGATLDYVAKAENDMDDDRFEALVELFKQSHRGPENAGKTLFLGPGVSIDKIGQTWDQLNLKTVQGSLETRICAASGVPAVVLGSSEGMQGSSLNAGNYQSAKRRFVDGTLVPLWDKFCGAFESLFRVPAGYELTVDPESIPFLREDVKDQAEILAVDVASLDKLIKAGTTFESAQEVVRARDVTKAKKDDNIYSVQVQQLPGMESGPQPQPMPQTAGGNGQPQVARRPPPRQVPATTGPR